jgi:hypothetical protein
VWTVTEEELRKFVEKFEAASVVSIELQRTESNQQRSEVLG